MVLITASKSELIDTWCYHVTGLRKIRKSAAMSSIWRYVWHILRGWGGPEVSHPLENEVNNLIQLFVCSAPSISNILPCMSCLLILADRASDLESNHSFILLHLLIFSVEAHDLSVVRNFPFIFFLKLVPLLVSQSSFWVVCLF